MIRGALHHCPRRTATGSDRLALHAGSALAASADSCQQSTRRHTSLIVRRCRTKQAGERTRHNEQIPAETSATARPENSPNNCAWKRRGAIGSPSWLSSVVMFRLRWPAQLREWAARTTPAAAIGAAVVRTTRIMPTAAGVSSGGDHMSGYDPLGALCQDLGVAIPRARSSRGFEP